MTERTVRKRTVFRGRLLGLDVVEVVLPNGRRSTREIVRHPGAVVVLPRLPDGRFVFVRQYRKAVERVLLEAPAGTRERGESPRSCALREVREETGYRAKRLTEMGVVIPAPGYADEVLYAYGAELGGVNPLTLEGGLRPDEDENLEVVALSPEAVERKIRRGEIQDAKTLAVWTLWRLKRGKDEGGNLKLERKKEKKKRRLNKRERRARRGEREETNRGLRGEDGWRRGVPRAEARRCRVTCARFRDHSGSRLRRSTVHS